MKKILIRDTVLDGKKTDILIEGNLIRRIAAGIETEADETVSAAGTAAVPPFYNPHCHASMSLFRGYADDMELFTWLSRHIWPAEAKLTPDAVYLGSRLAILEMIKSGTVFFNDMFWYPAATMKAAEEMKIRCCLGFMTMAVPELRPIVEKGNRELEEQFANASERIQLAYSPHAVYTVDDNALADIAAKAAEDGRYIHIHASETAKETEDCRKAHGETPVEHLDRLGVVTGKTVLAHCVHATGKELEIIAARGAAIAHCPVSNYKLVSGMMPFKKAGAAGARITIATDGCASNNSLSMFDEMKTAALNAKIESGDPTAGRAEEIWKCATAAGAEFFVPGAGKIREGAVADLMLLNLKTPALSPGHNLISDLVYAADTSCVDTVICDGNILMRNRRVDGEEEIIADAARACRCFLE